MEAEEKVLCCSDGCGGVREEGGVGGGCREGRVMDVVWLWYGLLCILCYNIGVSHMWFPFLGI